MSKVREINGETRGAYGSRRTSERLRSQGHDVGRYRARSLMKKADVSVKHRKKFKITTDSKHNLPIAPNLLNRNFQVDRPDAVCVVQRHFLSVDYGRMAVSGGGNRSVFEESCRLGH